MSGTGPNGRVVAADVEGFIAAGGSASLSATGGTVLTVRTSRTLQQGTLSLSVSRKPSAMCLITTSQWMWTFLRHAYAHQLAAERGVEISINDFVLKASAAAMKGSDANSAWMDTFIRRFDFVDINGL